MIFPIPFIFGLCREVIQFWSMRYESKSAGHFWENVFLLVSYLGTTRDQAKPLRMQREKMKESRSLMILLSCKLTDFVSGLPLNFLWCDVINNLIKTTILPNCRKNHSHCTTWWSWILLFKTLLYRYSVVAAKSIPLHKAEQMVFQY